MTGQNNIDPTRSPFAWMAREISLNRENYMRHHPEENGLKEWEMANFGSQKPQARRRNKR